MRKTLMINILSSFSGIFDIIFALNLKTWLLKPSLRESYKIYIYFFYLIIFQFCNYEWEDVLVEKQKFHDVFFRRLGYHSKTIPQRIFVAAETIVRRNVFFHFYANLIAFSRPFHWRKLVQTIFFPLKQCKEKIYFNLS